MNTQNKTIKTEAQIAARAYLILSELASDCFNRGYSIEDVILARRSSFGADNANSLKIESEFRKCKSVRAAADAVSEDACVEMLKAHGDLKGAQFVKENGIDTEAHTLALSLYKNGYGRIWTFANEA
jgi:hypothetical protein